METRSKSNSRKIRAGLLLKGYTLRGFARHHGFSVSTLKAVINGQRGLRQRGKCAAIQRALKHALKA